MTPESDAPLDRAPRLPPAAGDGAGHGCAPRWPGFTSGFRRWTVWFPDRTAGFPWWTACWFCCFGFLLVGIHVVHDTSALDETLLPRLRSLLAFLAVVMAVMAATPATRRCDVAVLREPIVACWAAYLAVTCGSLLVAVNPTAGLDDVFRTLGSFLVLCLAGLLLPTVPRWRERFVALMVICGAVAAGIGWWDVLVRLGPGLHGRAVMQTVTGLQSNCNLYAGFLNLLLPWCLCGVVVLGRAGRVASAITALATGAMLVLVQSRAAYVGLAAGLVVGLAAVWRWHGPLGLSRRVRNRLLAGCCGAVLTVVGFVATGDAATPVWGRVRSIFSGESALPGRLADGGRTRMWRLTGRLIADQPLLGVGAGNFMIRIQEYYGAADADLGELHTDNWIQPHNDFLWVWAEKGIVGLAVFLGIVWCGWRSIRAIVASPEAGVAGPMAVAALMALVANFVGSCFDFPLERVSHQVCVAAQFAAVTVLARGLRSPPPAASGTTLWPRIAALVALVPLVVGLVYTTAGIRQERFMILARRALRDHDWQAAVDHARRAATPWRTLDPLATPISFLEGMGLLRLGRNEEATRCLERARRENPNRFYVVNNLGILYAMTGRHDEAAACFRLAVDRYPDRVDCRVNLASCLLTLGRGAEAVAILEGIPEPNRTPTVRAALAQARAAQAASRTPSRSTGGATGSAQPSKE